MISLQAIDVPDISAVAAGQDIVLWNDKYLNMKLDVYLIRSHTVHTVKRNGDEKMNVAKNMEFVFVAAVVVATSLANAFAAPAAPLEVSAKSAFVKAPVAEAPVAEAPVITIVVVGKRPTAAQKAKRTV
jgi:hypothetical protein